MCILAAYACFFSLLKDMDILVLSFKEKLKSNHHIYCQRKTVLVSKLTFQTWKMVVKARFKVNCWIIKSFVSAKIHKNSALLGSNKNMLESNRNIKEYHTDNKIQQWKALSLNKPKHKNQIKSLILHHVLKLVKYVMYTNTHIYKSRLIYICNVCTYMIETNTTFQIKRFIDISIHIYTYINFRIQFHWYMGLLLNLVTRKCRWLMEFNFSKNSIILKSWVETVHTIYSHLVWKEQRFNFVQW